MARVRVLGEKPKERTRIGVVFSLIAPLLLIGISNPQLAFASPSVSLPSTLTAGTSFTNARGAGTISISGYDAAASVQATVSVTSGNLKITTVTGLTAPPGYSSADWTSGSTAEIAFYGAQTDVSNALNSLQYKASAVDAPATITVTTFAFGAAYNPSTGHFYEIVENGSVINWELARCKALYSNSDISVSAGDSLLNTNRCSSTTTLTRRTLGGLRGYLANITSLAEHEFLYTKLQQTGWIGGADTDSEGTFIWMDGPEKGQPFWNSSSTTRGGTNLISGSARYNYFNAGEPNNSSNEDFVEFGFGGGTGAWNDCRNECSRTRYVVEYGEDGDSLTGANGTINVNPRTAVTTETDTALSLSGDQYLESAQEAPFDIASSSNFTLEAWVRPTITNANQILLGKNNQYSLYISSNGSYGMNFYTTTTPLGTGGDTSIFRAGSVRVNEWQHVAVVRSGASVTGYVNGQALGTLTNGSDTSFIKAGSSSFVVGGYSASEQTFTGQIDQVRVWSSARTASQLQSGMTTFIPTPQTDLIASYGFNELSGTKIFNNATSSTWETDLNLVGGSTNRTQIAETSTVDAYSMVTFRRSYLTSSGGWRVPSGVSRVQTLLIAGGGGGGGGLEGGGGGAGGFIETVTSISAGTTYSVTVGMGGNGWSSSPRTLPTNGTNSIAFSLTAIGGGFGGVEDYNTAGIHYAPNSGGSGGGGSWGQTAAFYPGASGTSGQGNSGGSNLSYCCTAAGGGGAGGVGVNTSSTKAGDGGPGRTSAITGATYSGGGGGSSRNEGSSLRGVGGSGGGGTAGSTNGGNGDNGLANTGGGGGAAWANPSTSGRAGSGGSGIIIIRWITATAPIFTGPSSDTLTAGMVETFTVSGSPISPLTRGYRWQVSTDTGTTWVNATTGTGLTSASYVTPTLETTTSGTRYRYRVVVTDSDTAGLSIVETSTAIVFLTINPRITITGSSVSLTQKYGETQTVTYTIANGTGTRTTSASPNNRTGITWSSVSGSSATLAIASTLGFGTYYETLTVTDSVTASTTQMITIAISKADSITVTATPSTTTYNTSAITPAYVVSGLKNGETATATSNFVGINGTSYGGGGTTCETGGACSLGETGPGGGTVFYDAGITQSWGRYLEVAPVSWSAPSATADIFAPWGCDGTLIGASGSSIGSGFTNTNLILANCATAGIAARLVRAYAGGSKLDWSLPSTGELRALCAFATSGTASSCTGSASPRLGLAGNGTYYYSSTEISSGGTDKFRMSDGQFTSAGKNSSTNLVRPIRAFDLVPASSITTPPTDAGSYRYTVTDAVISAGASLNNYQGVIYESATVTINKAYQAKLTIGQYDAYIGISSYPINVYGGTGLGLVTRTLVDTGTAGCALSISAILTATQVGTCSVRAVKDGGVNYFAETTTATIYWITFINRYSTSGPTTPTDLGLSGSTAIEKRTYDTFTVLSFANGSGTAVTSAAKGSVMRIIGTGFDASDDTTEVIVGFFSIPRASLVFDTTNPLANFVQFTLPNSSDLDLGANDVAMKSRKGWAFASGLLTVTSPVSI
jgi:hypothetical protein